MDAACRDALRVVLEQTREPVNLLALCWLAKRVGIAVDASIEEVVMGGNVGREYLLELSLRQFLLFVQRLANRNMEQVF